jgi:hypothetical protein
MSCLVWGMSCLVWGVEWVCSPPSHHKLIVSIHTRDGVIPPNFVGSTHDGSSQLDKWVISSRIRWFVKPNMLEMSQKSDIKFFAHYFSSISQVPILITQMLVCALMKFVSQKCQPKTIWRPYYSGKNIGFGFEFNCSKVMRNKSADQI